MLHNPSLNERSECRLGVLMTARLAEDVPRRGTMREARNDGAPSCYASKMHSASPRLVVSSRPPINSPQSALASLA